MEAKDIGAVIKRLKESPVSVEAAVLPPPQGLPSAGGFYAWWVKRGALADVPQNPHPADPSSLLLYVGISPARESSSQTVRGRVIGNHINGNTGSSTFQFVLASFLMSSLELHPRTKGTKIGLDDGDNQRLRDWQYDNLRLTWCERDQPWEVEHSVIEAMKPPLNSAGNSSHPFYATVKAKRAAFRADASCAKQRATDHRPRRTSPRPASGQDPKSLSAAPELSAFLQDQLRLRGSQEVAAVEAAKWLRQAGLLPNSEQRPGLPLRKHLRAGSIAGAEQRPEQPNGRWFITRISA